MQNYLKVFLFFALGFLTFQISAHEEVFKWEQCSLEHNSNDDTQDSNGDELESEDSEDEDFPQFDYNDDYTLYTIEIPFHSDENAVFFVSESLAHWVPFFTCPP